MTPTNMMWWRQRRRCWRWICLQSMFAEHHNSGRLQCDERAGGSLGVQGGEHSQLGWWIIVISVVVVGWHLGYQLGQFVILYSSLKTTIFPQQQQLPHGHLWVYTWWHHHTVVKYFNHLKVFTEYNFQTFDNVVIGGQLLESQDFFLTNDFVQDLKFES